MKRVSATEAARRFSDVLDAVEGGRESFVVVRRGREVATISPASPASGKRLKALLDEHRPDSAWSGELEELRGALVDESAPWND
jgi:prevent-host-death family protein